MTPLDYYREQCSKSLIVEDQQQLAALVHIQKIYTDLLHEYQGRSHFFSFMRKPALVQGLYLWGGVGVGKTFLMDCLYNCIPFQNKLRMHFHEFMQLVQIELKKQQGKKDPLQIIAKNFAQQLHLLCFDELFVSDIADAMILARLFKALFAHGVCLVATSNVTPDDLYKNGLQRKLFLPAIDMLKQHTNVFHIATNVDYRLRHLKNTGVFFTPNDADAYDNMDKSFTIFTKGTHINNEPIEIYGRPIQIIKQSNNVIWFDFNALCSVPRSQHDYLAIAKKYHTVFLSGIPIFSPNAKNTISLFIRLIDILYDSHVRLIFSAESLIDNIYTHDDRALEYARTRSRLLEMQSEIYFSYRLPTEKINGNRS